MSAGRGRGALGGRKIALAGAPLRGSLPCHPPSLLSPDPRPPGLGRGSCGWDQQRPLDSLPVTGANPKRRGCAARPSGIWTRAGPRGSWGNWELLLLPVTGSPTASWSLAARVLCLSPAPPGSFAALPAFTPSPCPCRRLSSWDRPERCVCCEMGDLTSRGAFALSTERRLPGRSSLRVANVTLCFLFTGQLRRVPALCLARSRLVSDVPSFKQN